MAIDTAEKRRSASGIPSLPLGPGVTPDSGQGVEWRSQVSHNYYLVQAATVPDVGSIIGGGVPRSIIGYEATTQIVIPGGIPNRIIGGGIPKSTIGGGTPNTILDRG